MADLDTKFHAEQIANEFLKPYLVRLARERLWGANARFWGLTKPEPWPWYKKWVYRYWTRPWRAVRHSVCCGGEHDG